MDDQSRLKELLLEQLDGGNAHIEFSDAIKGLKIHDVGIRPDNLPHSIWELVEHVRLAQYDILEFSKNPDYQEPSWPDDYWPPAPQPENQHEWQQTINAFHNDRKAMAELIRQRDVDVTKPLEHGSGQTLFREAMLVVDHTSYHIGQIVQVRRLLGLWD